MKRIGFGPQGMVRFGDPYSRDGQSSAGFEELAMPLFDSLYNFARLLAHNSSDAEDLVQETYLKALRNFASFQSGTNFRAWIFQVLRNNFLSSCSKLERRMTVAMDSEEDGSELAVDTETPETILMNRFNSQLVQPAVADLPLHYREALLVKWRKCRIRRLRKYCRSRQKPLCRAWPERQFESHSLERFPDYAAWTLANSHSFGTD